ncbi:MAG: replication protein A [Halobacteriota archaeon]|nr:replication protein A [Halobacteriota archaeon]
MVKGIADQIRSQFFESGIDVSLDEIEKRLDLLINNYKVPEDEAIRTVKSYFMSKNDLPSLQPQDSENIKIKDIKLEGQWIGMKAKVIQLWENKHDSISQVGLLGDDTGTIKFVSWNKAALPLLDEGASYQFKSVVTDSYNDRFSVKFNHNTRITKLNEDIDATGGAAKISDITAVGQWINLRAKVLQIWDSNHESISQVGLLGDDSGTVKFTIWASSGLPELIEGRSYELKNVISDIWQDRINVKLNRNSSITEIAEDIDTDVSDEMRMSGAIVTILDGSGLIKRCTTCNRVLYEDGSCAEHGLVNGVDDLRIKGVIDDGEVAQEFLLNLDAIKNIAGISLEEAMGSGQEALMKRIKSLLLGRYFEVTGPVVGRYMLINDSKDLDLISETIDPLLRDEKLVVENEAITQSKEEKTENIDLVIDASNVAYWEDAKPKLRSLLVVLDKLDDLGIPYLCVVGPRLRHVIDDRVGLENLFKRSNVIQSPAKKDADIFVIDYAIKYEAKILSNDQYSEYCKEYPMLLEKGRIIEGLIFDGKISIPDLGI